MSPLVKINSAPLIHNFYVETETFFINVSKQGYINEHKRCQIMN